MASTAMILPDRGRSTKYGKHFGRIILPFLLSARSGAATEGGSHAGGDGGAFWVVSMLCPHPGCGLGVTRSPRACARASSGAVAGLLLGHLWRRRRRRRRRRPCSPLTRVLLVLTVAGAGYLVWLGVDAAPSASVPRQPQAAGSAWRQAVKGFGISGSNPKVFLLFLALLPQFVVATAPGR